MPFADFHTHTIFSDGKSTVREMIDAARAKKLLALGISDHSYTPHDPSYCMSPEAEELYERTVREEQKIALEEHGFPVLLGIEWDYRSALDREKYDYTIGSVHYVSKNGGSYPVDESAAIQKKIINEVFGGNTLDFAKTYFEDLVRHTEKNHPTFIGHFDLPCKYGLIGEESPDYLAVAGEALAEIVKHVPLFEVNMGAMARGLRTVPYPAKTLLSELFRLGGRVILSSDAHAKENIAYRFDHATALLREIGFTKRSILTKEGVVEVEL